MTTKPKTRKAPERLCDLNLVDALDAMKRRCYGLDAAIIYLAHNGDRMERGVAQLASDIAGEMESLAEAFEAERQLRIAEAS
jgi:hypothetical protein